MKNYTEKDLIHLAKRFNNNKRNFLLVNPLQAKHLAVSPSECLGMLEHLGEKVATKYANAKLVIGFAETATAVGFMVAKSLGEECNYISTTREMLPQNSYFEFKEEHSHAVDQQLYTENIEKYISMTDEIILVDDELTTGKTVLNFINQLKECYPVIESKKIIAVSIINRLNDENIEKLKSNNIVCEYVIKPVDMDYVSYVEQFDINEQTDYFTKEVSLNNVETHRVKNFSRHTNKGVNSKIYQNECIDIAEEIVGNIKNRLCIEDNILVLGTEECMYPAIVLGKFIEDSNIVNSVKCHATTRSPIGICTDEIYPIKNGFKISSFYESERQTFIYNLKKYDKVIVFTDSNNDKAVEVAIQKLAEIFKSFDTTELILIKGGFDV